MKKFLISFLLIPLFGASQSYKEKREAKKALMKIADTCLFPVPFEFYFIDSLSASKHEIYSKCVAWLATRMNSYKRGQEMSDSALGKIIIPSITPSINLDYRYTLTIDVKNNKYRCRFSDVYETRDAGFGLTQKIPFDTIENYKLIYFGPGNKHSYWQMERYNIRQEFQMLFADLCSFMRKSDDF